MSNELPRYWQSLAELATGTPPREDEFAEELPVGEAARESAGWDRRSFFKVMGLSTAAAMAACSRAPVQKIVPFASKPEELTPGLSLWYASTCAGCAAACGTLVKTRDGRPIKLEGNPDHPVSRGGLCAVGQAVVLSLYDGGRARQPSANGKPLAWAELDRHVVEGLRAAGEAGQAIRLVVPERVGPSAEAAIRAFLAAHPTARTVRFDAVPVRRAIADAHALTHGASVVPAYRLDQAKVIASFDADFLGTWVDPVGLTRQYTAGRDAATKRTMSRHFQIEALMSLTGTSADRRIVLAPSEQAGALAALVRGLARKSSYADKQALLATVPELPAPYASAQLAEVTAALEAAGADGLVLCGSTDARVQALANAANLLLGAYGRTLDHGAGVTLEEGTLGLRALEAELKSGGVGAVIFAGVNPVYASANGEALAALLEKVPLTVSTALRLDETAARVKLHAPENDPLESWGDAAPRADVHSVRQPAVAPLFDTRDRWESLLRWSRQETGHHAWVHGHWEREVWPKAGAGAPFQAFWDAALQRGYVELPGVPAAAAAPRLDALRTALASLPAKRDESLELALYEKVALRDGEHANNGWLQELPDPVTKVGWSHHVTLAPRRAQELGVVDGQVLRVRVDARELELPALIQPGQHASTLGLAVGYGRTHAGSVGNGVGANAYRLAIGGGATVTPTSRIVAVPRSQTHSSSEGRPHVREASLEAFLTDGKAGHPDEHGPKKVNGQQVSLWPRHEYPGHRWAMAVNLAACTGCSACVVGCQAENNIPTVGAVEFTRRRELHWLRIDRYYAGDAENPHAVHQPMMCQHCENAPCETVCPVLATVHSSEGLNQQVYNRCVGTRYCANNCPTKTRRFNWFDYPHDDALARMVLNPDVAVRSRGVMEKCSMCVQRIEEAKALAKREGRRVKDGEIQTACQQSCPAGAITFGDVNDPQSAVAKLAADPRSYRLVDELNVGAQIAYLTRIRNPGAES